jgi:hypothetical protein
VSKFLTVYLLVLETGYKFINDPVTAWVPELAAAHFGNHVETVQWSEVTIGALAGHVAGLLKDWKLSSACPGPELALTLSPVLIDDLTTYYNVSTAQEFGLPPLAPSEYPACGSDPSLPACSRSGMSQGSSRCHSSRAHRLPDFFQRLVTVHPVTSTFSKPVYSNVAFQILAYALEAMTNKTF